jgi:hypothetical protein
MASVKVPGSTKNSEVSCSFNDPTWVLLSCEMSLKRHLCTSVSTFFWMHFGRCTWRVAVRRYDMRHKMLTQRALFYIAVMARRVTLAESAFRDACLTSSDHNIPCNLWDQLLSKDQDAFRKCAVSVSRHCWSLSQHRCSIIPQNSSPTQHGCTHVLLKAHVHNYALSTVGAETKRKVQCIPIAKLRTLRSRSDVTKMSILRGN